MPHIAESKSAQNSLQEVCSDGSTNCHSSCLDDRDLRIHQCMQSLAHTPADRADATCATGGFKLPERKIRRRAQTVRNPGADQSKVRARLRKTRRDRVPSGRNRECTFKLRIGAQSGSAQYASDLQPRNAASE